MEQHTLTLTPEALRCLVFRGKANVNVKGNKVYRIDLDGIREGVCWKCGKTFSHITKHHTIPQRFKSFFNVNIPLCRPCHTQVDDIGIPLMILVRQKYNLLRKNVKLNIRIHNLNKEIEKHKKLYKDISKLPLVRGLM